MEGKNHMHIIIVGCGRIGSRLAYNLYKRGHDVSVVDADEGAFNLLPADFIGRLVEGDPLNQDVLHRAGIEKADALIGASQNDALNLAVTRIAEEIYHVKRVLARNYMPNTRPIFDEIGVQTVSSSMWGVQRMEELLYHSEIKSVFSAGNGEVDVYELFIPADRSGITLKDIFQAENSRVVSITRAGRAILPNDEIVLQEDDLVHFSATFEGAEAVRAWLGLRQEGK